LDRLEKVAIFLLILGLERAKNIIELMDSDEIKTIVPKISNLREVSPEAQECVWTEFKQLGYEDQMNPSASLGVIRLLFNGSKIRDNEKIYFSNRRSYTR